jgi:hypothetical protein
LALLALLLSLHLHGVIAKIANLHDDLKSMDRSMPNLGNRVGDWLGWPIKFLLSGAVRRSCVGGGDWCVSS